MWNIILGKPLSIITRCNKNNNFDNNKKNDNNNFLRLKDDGSEEIKDITP